MTQNPINNAASELTVDNLFLDGNTISSTDTNGNVIISPDGSGEVSVTAAPIVPSTDRADSLGSATNSWDNVYADGITFDDGTNTLGTYVATTSFTPVLNFGGATTGITYSRQLGSYSRIGSIAVIGINFVLSNKGSATGDATITGLPFMPSISSHVPMQYVSAPLSANNTWGFGTVNSSATTMTLRQFNPTGGGAAIMQQTNFTNISQVSGFFCFVI